MSLCAIKTERQKDHTDCQFSGKPGIDLTLTILSCNTSRHHHKGDFRKLGNLNADRTQNEPTFCAQAHRTKKSRYKDEHATTGPEKNPGCPLHSLLIEKEHNSNSHDNSQHGEGALLQGFAKRIPLFHIRGNRRRRVHHDQAYCQERQRRQNDHESRGHHLRWCALEKGSRGRFFAFLFCISLPSHKPIMHLALRFDQLPTA